MSNTPENVAELVEAYVAVRAKRLELDRLSAEVKTVEEKYKTELIAFMGEHGQGVVASERNALTLNTRLSPVAEDWAQIHDFVEANGAFDLYQHKLAVAAVQARWEVGEEIPGVGRFMVKTLSISKLNKGK